MTKGSERRSDCPISVGLDIFGDRWTLLVVRDLAFKGKRSFTELRGSDERIASNILSNRLARLEAAGIVDKQADAADRRRFRYRLTAKGVDLVPVLFEIIIWSARHDPASGVPSDYLKRVAEDREGMLASLRAAADAP